MGDGMSDSTERRERAQQDAREREERRRTRVQQLIDKSLEVEDLREKLKVAENSIGPLRAALKKAEEELLDL